MPGATGGHDPVREGRLESALAGEDPRLRDEYTKAWRSFLVRRDAAKRDARLKQAARARRFL